MKMNYITTNEKVKKIFLLLGLFKTSAIDKTFFFFFQPNILLQYYFRALINEKMHEKKNVAIRLPLPDCILYRIENTLTHSQVLTYLVSICLYFTITYARTIVFENATKKSKNCWQTLFVRLK